MTGPQFGRTHTVRGPLPPTLGIVTAPVQDPEQRPVASHRAGPPSVPAWRTPLIAGVAAASGCVAIALLDPSDSGVPICWSQSVFGFDCPLCGGLRATNALMRGQFGVAADHNVIVAVALPIVAVVWIAWIAAHMVGRPFRLPKVPNWLIGVVAVGVLTFTISRNVGGAPWVDWLAATAFR